jgi:oligoendopeptidase F
VVEGAGGRGGGAAAARSGGEPDYAFYLEDLRRTRPFTLDEKSEQIINLKDADGISG